MEEDLEVREGGGHACDVANPPRAAGDVVNPPRPAEAAAEAPKQPRRYFKKKKIKCGNSLKRGHNIPKTSAENRAQIRQARQSHPEISITRSIQTVRRTVELTDNGSTPKKILRRRLATFKKTTARALKRAFDAEELVGRLRKRIKTISLDKDNAYKLLRNQRIASKVEIRGLFQKIEQSSKELNKIEMNAEKKIGNASAAILAEKQRSAKKVREGRRISAGRYDSKLDKLAAAYDKELGTVQNKLEQQRVSYEKQLEEASEKIAKDRIMWMNIRDRKRANKLFRGLKVVNDPAESALATATHFLEKGNMIGKHNAAAGGHGRRDGIFVRESLVKSSKKKRKGSKKTELRLGFFHQLDAKVQDAILAMAIANAPETRDANRESVRKQQIAKLRNEQAVRAKAIESAKKRFENELNYYRMYKTPAYINDPAVVDEVVATTKYIKDQRVALGDNIKIRVVGFGWDDFKCTYINSKPVPELVEHLKKIIVEEKDKTKYVIPPEPTAKITLRKAAPIIGTITDDMRILNEETLHDEAKMKDVVYRLSRERKARGVPYSYYETYQSAVRPSLQKLKDEGLRIDMLWEFGETDEDGELTTETDLQWCQGKVIGFGSEEYEVNVMWDAMPDIEGWETATPGLAILHPDKWRVRNKDMGWRLDIDVEQFDNIYRKDDCLVNADIFEDDDNDDNDTQSNDDEDDDDEEDLAADYSDSDEGEGGQDEESDGE